MSANDPVTHHDLIYDLGMNNGDDTAYYLLCGFRVVAVEANPALVAAARHRFASELAAGRLTLLNVGVAPVRGTATFWICDEKDAISSFSREHAGHLGRPVRAVDIECCPFDELVGRFGMPHYLKIDLEGLDLHCLSVLTSTAKPRFISLELSDADALWRLRELGYKRFKIIDQRNWHRSFHHEPGFDRVRRAVRDWPGVGVMRRVVRRASRDLLGRVMASRDATEVTVGDGSRVVWKFPYGSSGAFGDHARGHWRSFDDAVYTWLSYRRGLTRFDERPHRRLEWFDVHATV
ncbi:MAG: FkbM family methyltransferase [Vicinamibacterales bacterium]